MPIVTSSTIPGGNVSDRVGSWRFLPSTNTTSYSHAFKVSEQPVLMIGSGILEGVIVRIQISPDNGATWQDWVLHEQQVQLNSTNTVLLLKVPGTYRVYCPAVPQPTVVGYPFTMTHEPDIPLTPAPKPAMQGPTGATGATGSTGTTGPTGGAEAGLLFMQQTVVSTAMLSTLNTASVIVVDAPGNGFFAMPVTMVVQGRFNTVAFSSVGDLTFGWFDATAGDPDFPNISADVTGKQGPNPSMLTEIFNTLDAVTFGWTYSYGIGFSTITASGVPEYAMQSSMENMPIQLWSQTSWDISGGVDSDLVVTVYYVKVSLPAPLPV